MLWHEFKFTLSHYDPEPYQETFLTTLGDDMYKNFMHTQKLELKISIESKTIASKHDATRIQYRLEQFLAIYKSAAPSLKSLSLSLRPFIPSDCAFDELWPSANSCNDIIYHLICEVIHGNSNLQKFQLEIGDGAWAFDVEFRPHLYQLLNLTAPKITSLGLAEHLTAILPFLPIMQSLEVLRFHSIGEPDEEETGVLWNTLAQMSLHEVRLTQLNFFPEFHRFVPHTLAKLNMHGLDDIVSACIACFTYLPNLEWCCLNHAKRKDSNPAPDDVLSDTVCTKLVQVCFLNSLAPANILSVIAKRNHGLRVCVAPPNVGDQDFRDLSLNCPDLRVITMSTAKYTPDHPVSRSALGDLSRLRRLQYLRLHSDLLPIFDISILSSIAQKNCILAKLTISRPEDRGGMLTRSTLREKLSGDDVFKDLFMTLLRDDNAQVWRIDVPDLRAKLG
jgi:hypothetical protein